MQIGIPNIKPVYCTIICHSGRMNISTHRNHVYVVFSIVTADSIATSVMGQAYVINIMNYFLRSSSDHSLCVTIAFFCQHRGMFQNSIRCLIIRTHNVLKPRDLCLELSNRSQIDRRIGSTAVEAPIMFHSDMLNLAIEFSTRALTTAPLIRYWDCSLIIQATEM